MVVIFTDYQEPFGPNDVIVAGPKFVGQFLPDLGIFSPRTVGTGVLYPTLREIFECVGGTSFSSKQPAPRVVYIIGPYLPLITKDKKNVLHQASNPDIQDVTKNLIEEINAFRKNFLIPPSIVVVLPDIGILGVENTHGLKAKKQLLVAKNTMDALQQEILKAKLPQVGVMQLSHCLPHVYKVHEHLSCEEALKILEKRVESYLDNLLIPRQSILTYIFGKFLQVRHSWTNPIMPPMFLLMDRPFEASILDVYPPPPQDASAEGTKTNPVYTKVTKMINRNTKRRLRRQRMKQVQTQLNIELGVKKILSEVQTKTKLQTQIEPKTEPQTQTQIKTEPQTQIEARTKVQTQTEIKTKSQTQIKTEPQTQTEMKTEPKIKMEKENCRPPMRISRKRMKKFALDPNSDYFKYTLSDPHYFIPI